VQVGKALGLLAPRARTHGVAAATIRRSQHLGALSYYCNWAAAQGQILLAMTNGEPAMSPEGGCDAFFGTNPIAASFPTGKGYPVKIDLATSLVARGHIISAQKQGRPIPPGWALDRDGHPTTDAAAALAGTVLTMAGHKGYALALLVETMSGVLSRSAVGSAVGSMYKDMARPQDVGHFFCLLDIDAFIDLAEFKQRIDAAIDQIKAGRRRGGISEILIPGERSHRQAEENRRNGIPLDEAAVRELRQLCQELGVEYTLEPVVALPPLRSKAESPLGTSSEEPIRG
jgi:LDH2 family malate/lactate/ureidoglycolate dehydrogenase